MATSGFDAFEAKMRDEGMTDLSISQFRRLYDVWQSKEAHQIPEKNVTPVRESEIKNVSDIHDSIDHDFAI